MGRTCVSPLVCRAMSCPSNGQGVVKEVFRGGHELRTTLEACLHLICFWYKGY